MRFESSLRHNTYDEAIEDLNKDEFVQSWSTMVV